MVQAAVAQLLLKLVVSSMRTHWSLEDSKSLLGLVAGELPRYLSLRSREAGFLPAPWLSDATGAVADCAAWLWLRWLVDDRHGPKQIDRENTMVKTKAGIPKWLRSEACAAA